MTRFGAFEVDLRTGELRKYGLRIRVQEQPFQVLAALLERPGEVVTREELVRRLWPDGTVVDYAGGINAAVTRLRQALSDTAATPRYIETVARRGYRFIAPVEALQGAAVPTPVVPARSPQYSPRYWNPLLALLLVVAAAGVGAVSWSLTHARSHRARETVTVTPLTTGLGIERNPSFSPDGTQVVYEWETEGRQQHHIYMKVVGAGDPIPLTSGAAAEYGPAWSFDGRLIAFLRQSEPTTVGLYVMAPLGGVERKVADAAAPAPIVLRRFMRRLAWTADSSHVIVSVPNRAGGGEGLLSVSVADGEKFWLTEPKAGMYTGDREPAVSPDGTCVAFARGELAASEVLNLLRLTSDLRPAGAPEPLSAAGRARSPAWSPDGSEILYTEVNPGMAAGSGISRIRIEKVAAPVPITALGPTVGVPAVARTGRVAYSRINIQSSIWRQELPTRGAECPVPTRLTSTAASDMNAQYSPDGHRIAFASNRSGSREIWTCNSDGAHCQAVTAFRGNYATGTPRWSPDGRQIAFDSGAAGDLDVYVIDANGGAPKRLTDDRTRGIIPNWSSDGKWIYFSSSRTGANEIWKISLAGGVAVPVTRSGGVNATESPDGKALYYSKSDGRGDLYRSQTDGSGEHLVLRGAAKRGFVVAEDRIYYLLEQTMHSATIRVLLLRNGADLHVARVSEPLFGGLSLSPDGRYLIYSQVRTAANLMLAEGVFRQR